MMTESENTCRQDHLACSPGRTAKNSSIIKAGSLEPCNVCCDPRFVVLVIRIFFIEPTFEDFSSSLYSAMTCLMSSDYLVNRRKWNRERRLLSIFIIR